MAITRTLNKRFNSFEAEEQWLNELAQSGWRLVDYSKEEMSDNRYEFQVDLEAKHMRYNIDYRTLKNKEEFDDYKEIFLETGWELIAKDHHYIKHIFISGEEQAIFSDQLSRVDRERRRSKTVLIFIIVFGIAAIATLSAKLLFHHEFLNVLIIFYTVLAFKYSYSFYKIKKRIRQLQQLR